MVFISPKDRVLELSNSNSQTVFAVTGAVDTSYNSFSAHMSVGDTTVGAVVEPGVAFKSGVLTYSAANQVTIDSTGFESKGTFSSGGTKEVFMGLPAKSSLLIDGLQTLTATQKRQVGVNLATVTNDNASAGGVGEYIELGYTSPGVTLSNNVYQTPSNLNAGISLSPGDWDVSATVAFVPSGFVLTQMIVGISLFSNAAPIDEFSTQRIDFAPGSPAAGFPSLASPVVRISLASTASVFLACRTSFASGGVTAYGKIRARRVR